MAFYKTKEGEVGGVYSSLYSDKGPGSLSEFPYMQLQGDAGVLGDQSGRKEEILKISKFDHIEELYLVAVNFTDAARNQSSSFAQFDGRVEVSNEEGKTITVVLASTETGSSAVFARIENSNELMGAVLWNESRVFDFKSLRTEIPGANAVSLANKLLLQSKGDSAPLLSTQNIKATLRWKASVDLDLYCFYTLKGEDQSNTKKKKGFFSSLFGGGGSSTTMKSGQIYFGSKGALDRAPYIKLDQDAGIGDRGGDNEENIHFGNVDRIHQAIIVANIYNKPNSNFAKYDGSVIIKAGTQEIEVPLTEDTPGAWCLIAQIENKTGQPKIVNINQTQRNKPESANV
jgi:uncharacterized protein involved in tellurium resistance